MEDIIAQKIRAHLLVNFHDVEFVLLVVRLPQVEHLAGLFVGGSGEFLVLHHRVIVVPFTGKRKLGMAGGSAHHLDVLDWIGFGKVEGVEVRFSVTADVDCGDFEICVRFFMWLESLELALLFLRVPTA
jgi:hypothetical protein